MSRIIVSVSRDGTLRTWSAANTTLIRVYSIDDVGCVAVSHDGGLAAWGTDEGAVGIVDLRSDQVRVLGKHSKRVNRTAINPDEQMVASASDDRSIRLWDVRSGEIIRILKGHAGGVTDVTFDSGGDGVASTSDDKAIKLWRLDARTQKPATEGHDSRIVALKLDSLGQIACSVSGDSIKVWNVNDRIVSRTLPVDHSSGPIRHMALSTDGRTVATVSQRYHLATQDVVSGHQWCNIKLDPFEAIALETMSIIDDCAPVGGCALVLLSMDLTIRVYSLETGVKQLEKQLEADSYVEAWDISSQGGRRSVRARRASIGRVILAGNGRVAVARSHTGMLGVWDLGAQRRLHEIKPSISPHNIILDHNGRWLLVEGQPVDRPETRRFRFIDDESQASGPLSMDSRHFTPAANMSIPVEIWDLSAARCVSTFPIAASHGHCVMLSKNGNWGAFQSQRKISMLDLFATGKILASLPTPVNLSAYATAPGDFTILAGDELGLLHVIDWCPGRSIHRL